jgi:uncharacterized membrane protein
MLEWINEKFMVLAEYVTRIFVTHDAMNFMIIQMVVAMILFALIVIMIAFRANIKCWLVRIFGIKK